ncbi:Activin_recp domain-containing protein [Caenorhabditis elegans]|uniref:Activin_recp domain-containing protein n=1 Tax=Caenorhabditis elegans TaxID=6239 RepID=Q19181_CAEEL|nr:Activin_recp domain-containing protein [Caenorhabditis elegans]CAA92661.1 Activin_recp domain-containing protein [Caenorhabditis elegans]|eukprot:NP_495872.1 Uncharacterized protein CELE_F07H5.7 [Caenorhabditis elegans]
MNYQFTKFPILLLWIHFGIARGDLIRTVYCANKCNDYLKVPEANIPKCEERHLKLNQCGTVISCSWADVELEKQRTIANATDDFVCCYDVVLKEKGDCDAQQAVVSSNKNTHRLHHPTDCFSQTPALFSIIAILLILLAAQSFYIMWTCAFQRRLYHQKVCQLEESTVTHSQGPLYPAKPVCETHLLSFEHLPN